jgi:type II secretion system protein N
MDLRPSKIFSLLGRAIPRRWPSWWTLPYIAWTAGCFVFFLAITFPHDLIVRRWVDQLAEESGWQVRYANVWLRPWNGYHLSSVDVVAPGGDVDPWLSVQEIALWPSWRVLVGGGVLPLTFSASAYGGEIDGVVQPQGAIDLEWSDLRIADYQRLTRLVEGAWAGEISGALTLKSMTDVRALEGTGKLTLRKASLTQGKVQGFTVPDLHFASGEGDLVIQPGRIDVRQLKLSGSEVDADAHGQVFLPPGKGMPTVSLTVNLKPIPGANPSLEPMLLIMKGNQRPPNGIYTTTVYGPLNGLRTR